MQPKKGMPKKLVDIAGTSTELRMEVDAVYTLRALVHVPWPSYVVDDVPVDAMECGVTERCIYMDFKDTKRTGYYGFGEGNRLATFSDPKDPNGLVVLNKVCMADDTGLFGACRRKVICHGDTMFRAGLSDMGEMQLYLMEGSDAVMEAIASPKDAVTAMTAGEPGRLCFTSTTIELGVRQKSDPYRSDFERARDAYDLYCKAENTKKSMQRPLPPPDHVHHMTSNRFGHADHGTGIHGVPTVEALGWKRNSR